MVLGGEDESCVVLCIFMFSYWMLVERGVFVSHLSYTINIAICVTNVVLCEEVEILK